MNQNIKELFNNKLDNYIKNLSPQKRAKYTINKEMYNNILNILKGEPTSFLPKFKYWSRETFKLMQIGSTEIIYMKKNNLPLITHEDLYEKILECHIAVGHSGRDKTWSEVKNKYGGIPQPAISIFIKMCDSCQTRRYFQKPISGKPIISIGFLARLQMDLIDMRSLEYENSKFILHVKDHFTKFSWLFALPSKEAKHVATNLRNLFYTFGPPKILQSDNGKEFVAQVILDLKSDWPELTIINGRPRHPESQGLVERSNAVVQKMLGKWQDTNKRKDWPNGLGHVMLSINNCVSQSTKKTPYEMVFGQSLRTNHNFWSEVYKQCSTESIINEENIPESIINHFNTTNEVNDRDESFNENDEEQIEKLSSNKNIIERNENTETSHKRIRQEGEKCYLETAERQLKSYQRNLKKQKHFQIGDIVGLKIPDVDRCNMAPSILPCKVVEIIENEDLTNTLYKVATLHGIITNSFSSCDFADLSQTISAEIRQLDTSNLSNITFIQACQSFTHYKSIHTCKCTGSCDTNRCPCKKKGIQCCSKCHRGKHISCKNYV